MQKHEWSLSEHQKDRVNQLEELRSDKQPDPITILALREVVHIAVGI